MSDERQADHTEDPREQDVGQGYPETSPPDEDTPSREEEPDDE